MRKKACLKPAELAVRWKIKEPTLSQWRWFGRGPAFLKLGTSITYRTKDIEKFENLQLHELLAHSENPVSLQISQESKLGNNQERSAMGP